MTPDEIIREKYEACLTIAVDQLQQADNLCKQWRVTAVRNGREFYSWHATRKEAVLAAKDQRTRGLFSRVSVGECNGR